MMIKQIFLILFSVTALASEREPSLDEVFKEAQLVCETLDFEANKPRCQHLFLELELKKSTKHVLSIARQACPEFAKICDRAYFYMGSHAPEYQQDFKTTLEARCAVDTEFCQVLGDILISEKQIEKGLEYLQKNFEVNGGYTYAIALKEHKNDVTLAHRVSWEKCQSDDSDCVFLVRNYPEHPQIDKALAAAHKVCYRQLKTTFGYDACSNLGQYYSKQNQNAKAIEYWSLSCPHNDMPCLEIIASESAGQEKKKWAFEKFCKYEGLFVEMNIQALRKEFCQKRAPASVPEKMISASKKLFH